MSYVPEKGKLRFADFGAFRDYVDRCCSATLFEFEESPYLTRDARLLIELIQEMRDRISDERIKRLPQLWQTSGDKAKLDVNFQEKVVLRLHRDVIARQFFGALVPVEQLDWVLLPPGQAGHDAVYAYFKDYHLRHPDRKPDFQRLDNVVALNPDRLCVGKKGFDGYTLCEFRDAGFAMAECPFYGNALYVIRGNYLQLSQRSKGELLRAHARHANRIIHTGRIQRHLNRLAAVISSARSQKQLERGIAMTTKK